MGRPSSTFAADAALALVQFSPSGLRFQGGRWHADHSRPKQYSRPSSLNPRHPFNERSIFRKFNPRRRENSSRRFATAGRKPRSGWTLIHFEDGTRMIKTNSITSWTQGVANCISDTAKDHSRVKIDDDDPLGVVLDDQDEEEGE